MKIKQIDDYLALVASQHQDKPNFEAVLRTLLAPLIDSQQTASNLVAGLDLDSAVGDQLDILGEWVQLSRRLPVAITDVYFAWDGAPGVGWDSGLWQGEYDSDTGLLSLPDDLYRKLLRVKIKVNFWDGSFAQLQEIWDEFLPNDRTGVLVDWQDMTIAFGYEGAEIVGLEQSVMLLARDLLKPAAVGLRAIFFVADGTTMFRWDSGPGWESASWSSFID